MEWEPQRQVHDLERHHRHRPPRQRAEQRELRAGKHVAALGAAGGQDGVARPQHVWSVRRIADAAQREIRLHAAREIEHPIVEQRPAAVLALASTQIDADLRLQLLVDAVEKMFQQDVFGGDRRVGFELEQPMAVRVLAPGQRIGGGGNGAGQGFASGQGLAGHVSSSMSAARRPDLIAPSMVAGKRVAVQSPASARLASGVRVPGRRRSCSAVAAKVARFSLITRNAGIACGNVSAARTSGQTAAAIASAGWSTMRFAALIVTETWPGLTNTHSAVPPIRPMKPAGPGSASTPKWMLRIDFERVRRDEVRQQRAGDPRRHGEHHRVLRLHWDGAVRAVQGSHTPAADLDPGYAVAEPDLRPARPQHRHRRIDQ